MTSLNNNAPVFPLSMSGANTVYSLSLQDVPSHPGAPSVWPEAWGAVSTTIRRASQQVALALRGNPCYDPGGRTHVMLEMKSFFALRLHGHQHIFFAALASTFRAVADWRWMLSELMEACPSGFQLSYYRFSSVTYPLWSQLISAVAKPRAKKAKDSPVTQNTSFPEDHL